MTPRRLRLGALLWLLTLQFFVVETVVQGMYELPYSRTDQVISRLGADESSGHVLMNASFVVQGALIVAGLLLLRPALSGRGGQVATAMLAAAAVGVVVVGVFPVDDADTWHRFGAYLYLAGSAIGLVGLAYAVRPRSEALGTVLAVLGLITGAMTVFFLAGVTGYLGEGGTERAAAYPLPIGLALAGVGLLRVVDRPVPGDGPGGRRALREQARAERIRRARERDEALEAAAAGSTPSGHPVADATPAGAGATATAPAPAQDAPDDDFDPDDPWATSPRRRES